MTKEEYKLEKARISYELYKNHKFFKKSRAIVLKNGKLLALKVTYKNTGETHYLFPGGSVDEGETTKQAVVRETLEEFDINVKVIKYLGKLYYKNSQTYKDITFYSNRIDYYYICEYLSNANTKVFGVDGEFNRPDRIYERVELSLSQIKDLTPNQLNDMDKNNYNKLVAFMEQNN